MGYMTPNIDRIAAEGILFTDSYGENRFELPPDSLSGEAGSGGALRRFSFRQFIAQWGRAILLAGVLLAVALRLVRRLAPQVRGHVREWRSARADSEATYFKAFRRVARSGDPRETANGLMAWLDRWDATPGPTTFGAFLERANDPVLDRQSAALDQTLYGAHPGGGRQEWSASTFARAVAKARRVGERAHGRSRVDGLAPVNPLGRRE